MKKWLTYLLIFASCTLNTVAMGQTVQTKIDSLRQVLKSTRADTSKIKLYNEIIKCYRKAGNSKMMIEYSMTSLGLCSKEKYPSYYEKANGNIWTALNDSGVAFYEISNYPSALDMYVKAIPYAILSNNEINLGYAYSNIGNVYKRQKNFIKAYEYYIKSAEIRKKINEKRTLSICYNNLGHIFKDIPDAECSQIGINPEEKLNQAKTYYTMALEASSSINETNGIAASYASLANLYYQQQKYPVAMEMAKASLMASMNTDNDKFIAAAHNKIAQILLNQSKEDFIAKKTAFESKDSIISQHLTEALKWADASGDLSTKMQVYESLAQYCNEVNKYQEAYAYHRKFKQCSDSIYNSENAGKMSDIITMYEAQKKQIEIDLLTKDKKLQAAVL